MTSSPRRATGMCGGIVGSARIGSTPAPRLVMSLKLGSAASSPGGAFHTSAVSISAGVPSSGETRTSSSGIAAFSAADQATGSSSLLENNNAPAILAPCPVRDMISAHHPAARNRGGGYLRAMILTPIAPDRLDDALGRFAAKLAAADARAAFALIRATSAERAEGAEAERHRLA